MSCMEIGEDIYLVERTTVAYLVQLCLRRNNYGEPLAQVEPTASSITEVTSLYTNADTSIILFTSTNW